MTVPPTRSAEDAVLEPLRSQFEVFLDEHRNALNSCLDGVTEQEARRSLVASRTTLLGLVKHAAFVERVWFDEAVTCRSRAEIGIPASPDESFVLEADDTIAGVQRAHHEACASSRRATASLGLDDLVHGNRRGPLPLRWVYLHVLRELAQHCGHADILREQLAHSPATSGEEIRVVRATRDIDADARRVFGLIADPAQQPRWDGNENLGQAASGQRVRAVGDVFVMTLISGVVRENHVVEFEEGRRIAWKPAEPGREPPGHLWGWELEPVGPSRTRVTHVYDWSRLTDEQRFARARATTAGKLHASLDRLAALCEGD